MEKVRLPSYVCSVQHPLTRYAGQAGWIIVPKEEAPTHRRGESGLFFYELLKRKLQDLNPGVGTPRWPTTSSTGWNPCGTTLRAIRKLSRGCAASVLSMSRRRKGIATSR